MPGPLRRCFWFPLAVLLLMANRPVLAQEPPPPDPQPPTRDELVKLVDAVLPPVIGKDNSVLVKKLLGAKLGKPIREGFDLDTAVKAIFGKNRPTFASDCRRLYTPIGDPDPGECDASLGQASGAGAYTMLSYSKHLGLGTVKYLRRLPAPTVDVDPATLKPVQIDKKTAYEKSVEFLVKVLGVPPEEIPQPPADAKNPYPVRHVLATWGSGDQRLGSVPIKQVIVVQRGLFVGIPSPGPGEPSLPWVQGPGRAVVVLDDTGIWQVKVNDWQELVPYPGVSEKDAKSRQELADEIADDLLNNGVALIDHVKSMVLISAVPDGTRGLLLPAVRVTLSPVAKTLSEADQGKAWTSAGVVLEYPLVRLPESKVQN